MDGIGGLRCVQCTQNFKMYLKVFIAVILSSLLTGLNAKPFQLGEQHTQQAPTHQLTQSPSHRFRSRMRNGYHTFTGIHWREQRSYGRIRGMFSAELGLCKKG